jgi:hypothetical protein
MQQQPPPRRRPLDSSGSDDARHHQQRRRLTPSPTSMDGVPPAVSVFNRMNQQLPITLLDHAGVHVPVASQCPLWQLFRSWKLAAVGGNAVVLRAASSKEKRDFVAVKLQLVRDNVRHDDRWIKHRTQDPALQAQAYRLPAHRPAPHVAELRNWAMAQEVLYDPQVPLAKRIAGQSNLVTLYDWAECMLEQRDVELFRAGTEPAQWQELSDALQLMLFPRKGDDNSSDDSTPSPVAASPVRICIMVMEWVPSESMHHMGRALPKEMRNYPHEHALATPPFFRDTRVFFQIWTQLCCLLCYLKHRVDYQHADLHLNNIMLVEIGPHHPLKNHTLAYDVPIRDQQGRYSYWRFQVPQPRYLVKLIDQGLSKTRACAEQDRRFVGEPECFTVSSRGHLGDPLFYLNRQDLHTCAISMLELWSRQWMRWDEGLVQGVSSMQERRHMVEQLGDVWAVLLHALGRHPVYPHEAPTLRDKLLPFLVLGYKDVSDSRYKWGEELHKLVAKEYDRGRECAESGKRNCESPELREYDSTSAGPWSLDEHLVLFSRLMNGHMLQSKPQTWQPLRSGHIQISYMMPSVFSWPADMLPQPPQSDNPPYPAFVGDPIREFRSNGLTYNVAGYNRFWERYREEQRCYNHLRRAML